MSKTLSGRNISKVLLANEDTFATSLLIILINEFGTEAFEWHPTTRRLELEQAFGVAVPTINGDKLNAIIDILTADSFFRRVPVFIQYCNVLSGSHPAFAEFDPADAEECAWGITEALLLTQPDEDEPFSEEVRYYIGKVLFDEGIKTPPDVLAIGLWDEGAEFGDMSVDDPTMFQAEFKTQEDESKEIEQWLRNRLSAMLREIESIPLEGDGNKNLLSKLRS